MEYGIFGAEPWSEEMRTKLEETFNLKAIDIYGLSEIIGPGVSLNVTKHKMAYMCIEDHFYIEVIDPKHLNQLLKGRR